MTAHRHSFTAATEDGLYHCDGCDTPRAGPLALCPNCREVTGSYLWNGIEPFAQTHLETRVMADIDGLNALRAGDLGLAPVVSLGRGRVGA